jgi:hypothetical protein
MAGKSAETQSDWVDARKGKFYETNPIGPVLRNRSHGDHLSLRHKD